MTENVKKIVEEGKAFGFEVSQSEYNVADNSVIVEGEYKFYEYYKLDKFNWKTVIEDFGRESFRAGQDDHPHW